MGMTITVCQINPETGERTTLRRRYSVHEVTQSGRARFANPVAGRAAVGDSGSSPISRRPAA